MESIYFVQMHASILEIVGLNPSCHRGALEQGTSPLGALGETGREVLDECKSLWIKSISQMHK